MVAITPSDLGTARTIFYVVAVLMAIYGLGLLLFPQAIFTLSNDPGVPANPGWVRWAGGFVLGTAVAAWFAASNPESQHPLMMGLATAFTLVTLASSWKQISYNFVFFVAGLQNVPATLVEASDIDGAGPAARFWRIVFPLLSPTTFYLLVMNLVYAFFETFPIIHQVTQGGPNQDTTMLVYKVYRDGVFNLDLGSSSAQSVVLMALVISLTILQFRFVERRVTY